MKRLFVDTSAWVAYANRADPDHRKVSEALRRFRGRRVTSNFIFDETVTFCRYRFGHDLAMRIGDALNDRETVDMIRITAGDEMGAWRLLRNRPDKEYSFTDCTSFVLMKRLGITCVAALDQDFRREGFEVLPSSG